MSQKATDVSVNGQEYDHQHHCDRLRDVAPTVKVLRPTNAARFHQFVDRSWRVIEHDVVVLLETVYFCPLCGEDLNEDERIKKEKDMCLMH